MSEGSIPLFSWKRFFSRSLGSVGSVVLLVHLLPLALSAQQDSLALRYAATITEADMRTHLTILASDAYMGRDTGKEGQKMAAAYLKSQFQKDGIPPVPVDRPDLIEEGYFQTYQLVEEKKGSIRLMDMRDTLTLGNGLIYFGEDLRSDRNVKQLQWLGNGASERSKKVDPVVLLVEDGSKEVTEMMVWAVARMEKLREKGAEVIIIATPRMAELEAKLGHQLSGSRVRLADGRKKVDATSTQLILIDAVRMEGLFPKTSWAKLSKRKGERVVPVDLTLVYTPQEGELQAENVLAYIEGTDKKEELVVITAHYDHIGVENGVVYNGADDDGSGTVALLGIAKALARAKAEGHGPRRSVLVMPVSGEEKGLLGSRYYSEHPVFPLENTVADLNIDMIGRTDSAHMAKAPYVYVIGSDRLSMGLHDINEAANTNYSKLDLDYTFNAPDDPNRFYFRSDHYNFARKGVPSIFYFSGVHEDYHQPGDDVEKIQFDLLHQRTLLVFHTAWMLANMEERIAVDKALKP